MNYLSAEVQPRSVRSRHQFYVAITPRPKESTKNISAVPSKENNDLIEPTSKKQIKSQSSIAWKKKDCTCVDCLCNVAKNDTNSSCSCDKCMENPKELISIFPASSAEHDTDCTCIECLFKPQNDNEQSNQYYTTSVEKFNTKLKNNNDNEAAHPLNCECPSCLTSPDSPIKLPKEITQHSPDCGCIKCCFKNSTVPKAVKSAGQMVEMDKSSKNVIQIHEKNQNTFQKHKVKRKRNEDSVETIQEVQNISEDSLVETTVGNLQETFEKLHSKCRNMNDKVNFLMAQLDKRNKYEEINFQRLESSQYFDTKEPQQTNDVATEPLEETSQSQNLEEMEVTEARRISSTSLLLLWTPGKFTEETEGYEILVNGLIKSRVYSASRNCAVVHDLDFNNNLYISVYAVSNERKLEPPARALFKI